MHLDGFARFVIAALAALMVAFFVGSAVGIEPAWIAVGGAAVVGVVAVANRAAPDPPGCSRRRRRGSSSSCWRWRWWCDAAGRPRSRRRSPATCCPHGDGLLALLAMAGLAAVLANLVNNVPATLVILVTVVPAGSTALLLAMLLGVNVGPEPHLHRVARDPAVAAGGPGRRRRAEPGRVLPVRGVRDAARARALDGDVVADVAGDRLICPFRSRANVVPLRPPSVPLLAALPSTVDVR